MHCEAAKVRDDAGRLPLQIAVSVGASEMIKNMVFDAITEVVEGLTLHEVVEGVWGDPGEIAVASVLKAAPEVMHHHHLIPFPIPSLPAPMQPDYCTTTLRHHTAPYLPHLALTLTLHQYVKPLRLINKYVSYHQ